VKRSCSLSTFTEGPAVDRDGNVYFTDQPNDRIVKYNALTVRSPTGVSGKSMVQWGQFMI
jgi:sugar lactone lactonase YvrE